jgi:hypothetical protein
MPLTYDDIPGSWGIYSAEWPSLQCTNKIEADRAFVACTKESVIPYGSYVLVGTSLRVETNEMLQKLIKHLKQSPMKTAEEVINNQKRLV